MMTIGILGVNKPAGMTSFDVVRKMKKITGIKKIGHGGTLDPMATGVLPILLNEATAFFDLLLHSKKVYEAVIQLGVSTDTDDKEGVILEEVSVPSITIDEIKEHIKKLTGKIQQVPPAYSALKVNGKKAYELARAGKEVVLEAREVHVHQWTDLSYDESKKQISVTIHCGSGTYIRSLAKDLAEFLGTKGHLISLNRTYSGGISLDATLDLEQAEKWEEFLISPEKALDFLPKIEWTFDYTELLNGKPLTQFLKNEGADDGIYGLYYNQKIVALIEKNAQKWNYKKNFSRIYQDKV